MIDYEIEHSTMMKRMKKSRTNQNGNDDEVQVEVEVEFDVVEVRILMDLAGVSLCNSATVTFSFFLSSLFRSLLSFSLSSFFLFPHFVSLIVCRFSTFARFLSLACCLEAARHFSCPVPSRLEQQQHACNNTQHQAREVHLVLTILLYASRALSPQGTHLSIHRTFVRTIARVLSVESLTVVSGLCSINPLARSPSLAMSSPPAPSPHHSPLSGPSSSPPAMVVDPAEYQRVLEENERMRNAGTLLEQQLAVAESEKLKLSTALASSSTPAPAVVAPPRISQAIAPSAHVKGPPLTSFTGSMGFEVDHWLRSVRKQFNFFGSAVFPDDLKRIAYAALYLEGAALDWWESEDRADVTTWEAFVALLHKRWQPRLAAEVARQKIASLKQRGTVSQLCNIMQQLMTRVPTMHEDDKIFAFEQALDQPLAAKVAERGTQVAAGGHVRCRAG